MESASRTSPVEPVWMLRFIGFKFICSARSMGNIFTVQIWIICINIVACKMCVITRVRSWMGSMFHNLDSWLPNIFPGIAKKKGKVYATKNITICWWQGLHVTNQVHIFCVTIMSLCSTINQVLLLKDPNLGLSNPLETVKKLQYSVRCAIAVKHNYINIQIVLPLTWTPELIAKNDAHYLIYIYVYHEPRTGMLGHTPLESSRRQSRIATVHDTETDKPDCNIDSLYNTVNIFITIPD